MRFPGRSLFRKIFAWFCLAITLALLSSSIVLSVAHRAFHAAEREAEPPEQVLRERSRAAVAIAEKGGAAALADYARGLNFGDRDRTWVLDENGRAAEGEQVPAAVLALAAAAVRSGRMEYGYTEYGIAAVKIKGSAGRSWLIGLSRRQPPPDGNESLVIRLLVEIAAVALAAFLLARYIASPVLALREASSRIESGDLSARVMERPGYRHDELGDLGRNFDRMAARIQALVNAQRDLIRDVSHELRSPLARLSVALGLARRLADDRSAGHLDRIEYEAERLNTLIGQLLTLSRLDAGPPDPGARFDLCSLVQEVAADGAFEARARNCSVTVETCPDCFVRGSVELLRGALENVVRNAVRFTAAGSAVEILLRRETPGPAAAAVLTVRDHGPGVPPDELERIFEPFHRVRPVDGDDTGTGLGLAIASRAVRLHGGSAQACNAPGGGLRVTLRLPAGAYPQP